MKNHPFLIKHPFYGNTLSFQPPKALFPLPNSDEVPGGGGGVLGIYIGRGVPWHTKKGGLRCGHSPKKRGGGVLGAGTTRKRGYRHVYNPKKGEFRTHFVKREGVRN